MWSRGKPYSVRPEIGSDGSQAVTVWSVAPPKMRLASKAADLGEGILGKGRRRR